MVVYINVFGAKLSRVLSVVTWLFNYKWYFFCLFYTILFNTVFHLNAVLKLCILYMISYVKRINGFKC